MGLPADTDGDIAPPPDAESSVPPVVHILIVGPQAVGKTRLLQSPEFATALDLHLRAGTEVFIAATNASLQYIPPSRLDDRRHHVVPAHQDDPAALAEDPEFAAWLQRVTKTGEGE